jgi:hypothetical protein
LVDGCPTLKNVLSHYWKVKIYELSKMPYFYYLVNPEAELFNPLKSLMTYMWIKGCWVPFPNKVTCALVSYGYSVQHCWDFFLGFSFFCVGLHKKLNHVIPVI